MKRPRCNHQRYQGGRRVWCPNKAEPDSDRCRACNAFRRSVEKAHAEALTVHCGQCGAEADWLTADEDRLCPWCMHGLRRRPGVTPLSAIVPDVVAGIVGDSGEAE